MTFGEKVKAERTKLGMSQDELAAKIGVTRRIIGSYENDKSRPRGMERYKKLAESLNVNVNYLLSEDDAFIADVEDKYGRRGARQAQELLAEVTGLFAGGEMADEDMREMVDAIQEEFGLTAAVAAAPAAGAAGADLCSGFHLQQPLGRDLDRAGPALLLAGAAGAGHRPDIPPA